MKYGTDIVRAADEALAARRQAAQSACEARKEKARAANPRFAEIEAEMAKAAAGMTHGVLRREGAPAVWRAKEVITALQAERAELLTACRLPRNTYAVEYTCRRCNDTGVSPKGGPCECYETELRRQAYKSSVLATALAGQTFNTFDLAHYSDKPDAAGTSPRYRMEKNLAVCRAFVKDFETPGRGLLMTGPTGLGKTHLSSAIAGELAAQGYGVQYDMAANILRRLEDRRFGRAADPDPEIYLTCDLLVMDDLGSEYATSVTLSELFTLVNTRLITGRKTIVSTNYTVPELAQNYTQKLTSRFLDSYTILQFAGEDLRMKRRQTKA
ncbi:MAG TPA: ATP-binding protein [Candidatus Acidoferrum sp.]|nr:ATP-binding protein [Candidatus Acidoferrum sp.]